MQLYTPEVELGLDLGCCHPQNLTMGQWFQNQVSGTG